MHAKTALQVIKKISQFICNSVSIDLNFQYQIPMLIHNPNLKCHLTLINSNNLCNNSNLSLILSNNSDHKICIPCNITIGTSETINILNYNRNDITFAATSDTPFQNANTIESILNDHKPQYAPMQNSILKVIMQIKSISTTIKHKMLPLMLQQLTTTILQ